MSETLLKGCRVLIVEDRYLIADEIARQVEGLSAEVVGPVATVAAAEKLARSEPLHAALLDVDLDGEAVFPVADALSARKVPLIFLTGYDDWVLPPQWRDHPHLRKPVNPRELRNELAKLLRAGV
jgi:DNA-binding response OmpR family regulator